VERLGAARERALFDQVATKGAGHHALMGLGVSKRDRLEQQENSTGGVSVGVVFTPDEMDQLVTEGHRPEDTLAPRLLHAQFGNDPANLSCQFEMFGIGRAIDQECPVDIAAVRKFIASERTEDHDAEIRRGLAGKRFHELRP
jgi:hypothetical protein